MKTMKLKKLQDKLKDIEIFENPKIDLQQYITSSDITAIVLHTVHFVYCDIEGKTVADLGCGSGVLSIGAVILGAKYCAGFDINPSAISLSLKNATDRDLTNRCDFILCDVKDIDKCVQPKTFDTVIMNPPFGTIKKGTNFKFLKSALNIANKVVYSLHKRSTRKKVMSAARNWDIQSKVIAELRFELPECYYKLDDSESISIEVDLIRFIIKRH